MVARMRTAGAPLRTFRLGGVRTAWSVWCEDQNPEIVRTYIFFFLWPPTDPVAAALSQAWAQLNRRMRPVANKLRERVRPLSSYYSPLPTS